ncbi:nucleotide exchange factor GrpE [Horticoccus luteus]|uniref:Protein GrpE n=1 Tax=Horticoccus luteus TaxID=2862869 RepID=A0A8F9XHK7_9BACT|nr:nucleotide exchange factor GrpE [Horticoccus luteus]QYM79435.1 nucleotide exchange factor GrpE [Horticoccus luteus]
MTKDSADTTEPTSAAPGDTNRTAESAEPIANGDVATAKKEAAEHYDRYVRAVADHENFRKRTVREKEELRLFAASRVLEDLLPVLDNLGLGLAAAKQPNADVKALTAGVEMVLTQLKSALANHGLKEIAPAGQVFDPNLHEAISHQPSADVPAEHVSTVVRTGYSLNGRLLRPASVVVSSGPAKEGKS